MFKCLKCGKMLKRIADVDDIAEFKCPSGWCNSYFTLEFLEDDVIMNEGEINE